MERLRGICLLYLQFRTDFFENNKKLYESVTDQINVESKDVKLIPITGNRKIFGFNKKVMGQL